MKYYYSMNSPLGELYIYEENEYITNITFGRFETDAKYCVTELINECINQLNKYFSRELKEFRFPIKNIGTSFQMQVWEELLNIPYGEVISYKELAKRINNPKAIRAVGGACHNNNIAIVVPCHRVIGKNKKLVGYAGGLDKKSYLLELEMKNK